MIQKQRSHEALFGLRPTLHLDIPPDSCPAPNHLWVPLSTPLPRQINSVSPPPPSPHLALGAQLLQHLAPLAALAEGAHRAHADALAAGDALGQGHVVLWARGHRGGVGRQHRSGK